MYKAKKFMLTSFYSKKSPHILEENASSVQVGDIEQVMA